MGCKGFPRYGCNHSPPPPIPCIPLNHGGYLPFLVPCCLGNSIFLQGVHLHPFTTKKRIMRTPIHNHHDEAIRTEPIQPLHQPIILVVLSRMESIKNDCNNPSVIYFPSPAEEQIIMATANPPPPWTFHFPTKFQPSPKTNERSIPMLPIYPKNCISIVKHIWIEMDPLDPIPFPNPPIL